MSTITTAWSPRWIVMAADSRTTVSMISPDGCRMLGRFDDAFKVFVFPEVQIGVQVCGPAAVGGHLVSSIIEDFTCIARKRWTTPKDLLTAIVAHFADRMAVALPTNLCFYAAGFVNGSPQVARYGPGGLTLRRGNFGFACNHGCCSWGFLLRNRATGLISLATSHIEGHSTGRGTTGGPIDCLLISPTRHLWIKRKKPTMRYSTLEDFAIAADAGLIPVRTF